MTLGDGHKLFREGLNQLFQNSEIDFYFKAILKDRLYIDPIQLGIEPNLKLTLKEEIDIKESLLKLISKKPIQYVTGRAHFRELILKVDRRVLIPRPETEEIVGWILDDFNSINNKLRILDMGTGSGCIGISLAKEQSFFSVFVLDKDKDILDLTAENAKINGVRVKCIRKDIYKIKSFQLKIDVIVSNPPYVSISEQNQMKSNVLDYEPHQAIFVSNSDPLVFYRLILEFAARNLHPNGYIYFEINPLLLDDLKSLITTFSYTVLERLDIFGKVRMLRLQKN